MTISRSPSATLVLYAGLGLLLGPATGCSDDGERDVGFEAGSEAGGSGTGDGDGDGSDSSGSADGDGDSSGDGDGDGDGDGGPGCGDGVVDDGEACDDGVNDGGYDGCLPDCSALAPHCGDGEVNGPEQCDDQNLGTGDGCLGDCSIPRSCREILAYDPGATDGSYVIAPKSPDLPFMTRCDMSTEGGGWTEIPLAQLCSGNLDTQLTAIEGANTEGIDDMCRPFTRDGGGDHVYVFDLTFPPGFEALYLSEFVIRANAGGGQQSEIVPSGFIQTSWDLAHGDPNTAQAGDVSFGSADDDGPVISYGSLLVDSIGCQSCETPFPAPPLTTYVVGSATTLLRVGWGEAGGEAEGWYPWWSGSVYLR